MITTKKTNSDVKRRGDASQLQKMCPNCLECECARSGSCEAVKCTANAKDHAKNQEGEERQPLQKIRSKTTNNHHQQLIIMATRIIKSNQIEMATHTSHGTRHWHYPRPTVHGPRRATRPGRPHILLLSTIWLLGTRNNRPLPLRLSSLLAPAPAKV